MCHCPPSSFLPVLYQSFLLCRNNKPAEIVSLSLLTQNNADSFTQCKMRTAVSCFQVSQIAHGIPNVTAVLVLLFSFCFSFFCAVVSVNDRWFCDTSTGPLSSASPRLRCRRLFQRNEPCVCEQSFTASVARERCRL